MGTLRLTSVAFENTNPGELSISQSHTFKTMKAVYKPRSERKRSMNEISMGDQDELGETSSFIYGEDKESNYQMSPQ